MKDQKLTDAEKDLMEIIWQKNTAFMKDIIEEYPEPKPATTTIATLLKRMQNKDLIGYKTYGNSREYFPKVSKEVYFKEEMTSMIDKFFAICFIFYFKYKNVSNRIKRTKRFNRPKN